MNIFLVFPLLLLGFWLGIILHEGGHYVCARIAGLRVRVVTVGAGAILARWRKNHTDFELRMAPWSGAVELYPTASLHRARETLFVMGGIFGNIGLLCLLSSLDACPLISSAFGSALKSLAVAQYIIIVTNILPFTYMVGGKRSPSDGLILLRLWFLPNAAHPYLKQQLAAYETRHVVSRGSDKILARVALQLANADKWASTTERHNSIVALEREIQSGGLSTGAELLLLDALITRGLTADDPALHGKLDQWSKRAIELGGHLATIRASRGAVLSTLGRYDAARALLETVPTGTDAPLLDVVMTKIFLARTLAGLGERDTARRLAAEARDAAGGPENSPRIFILIDRVEGEITSNLPSEAGNNSGVVQVRLGS